MSHAHEASTRTYYLQLYVGTAVLVVQLYSLVLKDFKYHCTAVGPNVRKICTEGEIIGQGLIFCTCMVTVQL